MACAWPSPGSKSARCRTSWPRARRPSTTCGVVARLDDGQRRRPVVLGHVRGPARRRHGRGDVQRRRRRAPTRPGRRPAAGSRRPSSHGRPTAGRRGRACPGVSVCIVRLPRRQDVDVARIEAERGAPVLVADAGLGIDQPRAETVGVGLDEADDPAPAIGGGEVDRAATGRRTEREPVAACGPGRCAPRCRSLARPRAALRARRAPSQSGSVSQRSRSASVARAASSAEVDPGSIGDPVRVEGAPAAAARTGSAR